ncbi:hypothetical protein H2203_003587 [Taxawa tesnikishii (nom. ined.)]|nr:hypothetical protein H2203_003587 [Dothideales sp. JES 119]
MQHRAVASLQNESAPITGSGNYSRTPELRISHKLAERKRRSEMKDLFEELNKAVPTNGGAKASKWEILTKAIDYIRQSQINERSLQNEVGRLRQESEFARDSAKENELLRTEILVMHERLRRLEPNNPHMYGQYTSQLTQNQAQANGQPPPFSLPPMNSVAPQQQFNSMAPSVAMQGVEYGAPSHGAYGGR